MKTLCLNAFFLLAMCCAALLSAPMATAQQLMLEHQLLAPGIYPPAGIQLADMDGDGDLDLVGGDLAASNALVYLNQNGKMDSIPQIISQARFLAIIDWNADGLPDFLIKTGTNTCLLRFNEGSLAFSAGMLLPGFSPPNDIQIQDLNLDGYPDIFSSSYSVQFGYCDIWINNQGSNTPTYHSLTTQDISQGIAYDYHLCDLDADGLLELVQSFVPEGEVFQTLRILKHNGNFDFVQAQLLYLNGDAGAEIHTVDLDGDQRSEIVYTSNPGNWRLVQEIAPGQYSDQLIGISSAQSNFGRPYDFDGNGFKDCLIGNQLFLNNQFVFNAIPVINPPSSLLADTDSDGLVESYWVELPARIRWTEYVGNGVFQPYQTLVNAWPADESVTAMDIENDGDIDFLYFSYHTDYLILSKNDNGVYSESILNSDDIFPHNFLQFDYNGDGFQDFMASLYLFVNDGQGHFSWPLDNAGAPVVLPSGFPIGTADFNNDGLDDVVVSELDQSQQYFTRFYANTGNGFVQMGPILPGGANLNSFWECKFNDLNGDGWKEMILVRSGEFYVYPNHEGLSFSQGFNGSGEFVGVSDMNGDGLDDLIVTGETDIKMWPNLGNYTFGLPESVSAPFEGFGSYFGVMVDLTGDGLDDIIVDGQQYPSTYAVMVNQGTSFGKPLEQGPLENIGSDILRAPLLDFDQDGDLDVCLAQQYLSGAQRFGWYENLSNSPNKIVGRVFFDANGNGVEDSGESAASGIKLTLEGLGAFSVSDSSGQFYLPTGAATGDFTIKIISPADIQMDITTPNALLTTISNSNPTDTTLIGLRITGIGAALSQALSSHRCNESARLWLPFTPLTNGPASGELRLTFPDGIVWQDMDSLPGVVRQGREIRWPLSQLPTMTNQMLWVDFVMPNFQFSGDTLIFTSELLLQNGADSVLLRDTMIELLTCAYDPNDKLIANLEQFYVGDEYYSLTSPEVVEYLIRFQNTGNDTAKQVVILDNLSPVFDYNNLQVLGSSHPCRVNLDYAGLMRVEFADINLPDSAANFIGSMGFVKFSIPLKPEPPRNKPIRNLARIFFDQNPPVLTKPATFRVVDCRYFMDGFILPDGVCESDSFAINIVSHGLTQNYVWVFNDSIVSSTNHPTFHVNQQNNQLSLTISNELCQTDTAIAFHSAGSYPDLQLSVDSSAVFCEGTTLEITSNIPVRWYQDGVEVWFGSTYQATVSQTLLARTYIDGTICQAEKTINLVSADLPEKLILEGDPSAVISRCPGDSLVLSTSLETGDFRWFLYDPLVGQEQEVSSASSYQYTFGQAPYGHIRLVLDTLNCMREDFRPFQLIPEGPIQIAGDSVICADIGQVLVYTQIGSMIVPYDSLFCYKGDNLLQVAYHSQDMFLDSIVPGEYTFVAYAACNHDTIQRTFYPLQPFLSNIQVGEDTLFSGNGQSVDWFYAPTLDNSFLYLGNWAFLGSLSTGYYFMAYTAGNCAMLSDTVFVQSVRVETPLRYDRIKLFPNPNPGTFTVEFPVPTQPGTQFRIIDLTGRLVQEQKTEPGSAMQTVRASSLPAGLYFLQVVAEGKVLALEKFVKQ